MKRSVKPKPCLRATCLKYLAELRNSRSQKVASCIPVHFPTPSHGLSSGHMLCFLMCYLKSPLGVKELSGRLKLSPLRSCLDLWMCVHTWPTISSKLLFFCMNKHEMCIKYSEASYLCMAPVSRRKGSHTHTQSIHTHSCHQLWFPGLPVWSIRVRNGRAEISIQTSVSFSPALNWPMHKCIALLCRVCPSPPLCLSPHLSSPQLFYFCPSVQSSSPPLHPRVNTHWTERQLFIFSSLCLTAFSSLKWEARLQKWALVSSHKKWLWNKDPITQTRKGRHEHFRYRHLAV